MGEQLKIPGVFCFCLFSGKARSNAQSGSHCHVSGVIAGDAVSTPGGGTGDGSLSKKVGVLEGRIFEIPPRFVCGEICGEKAYLRSIWHPLHGQQVLAPPISPRLHTKSLDTSGVPSPPLITGCPKRGFPPLFLRLRPPPFLFSLSKERNRPEKIPWCHLLFPFFHSCGGDTELAQLRERGGKRTTKQGTLLWFSGIALSLQQHEEEATKCPPTEKG